MSDDYPGLSNLLASWAQQDGRARDELVSLVYDDLRRIAHRYLDVQQSRIVELRFFGGLTVDETAAALEISPSTVKREWASAKAWLLLELVSQ